jgi:hypothetical protein
MGRCDGHCGQPGRAAMVNGAAYVLCSWCAANLALGGAEVVVSASWADRPPGVGDLPAAGAGPVRLYPGAVGQDGPAQPST